jgi:prepilin-type processing-associated H-X9-DG protein
LKHDILQHRHGNHRNILYSDGDDGLLKPNGQLVVKVDASQYNATLLKCNDQLSHLDGHAVRHG